MRTPTHILLAAALLVATAACTSAGDVSDDETPAPAASASAADDQPDASPEPTPDPLAVTVEQLYGPALSDLVDGLLQDALAVAEEVDDVDGDRMYWWGPSRLVLGGDDLYTKVSSTHPAFISIGRDGAAFDAQYAAGQQDDHFAEQWWSEDGYATFYAQLLEDPDGDTATGADDGEVHVRHADVYVAVDVHADEGAAAEQMTWLAEEADLYTASFYAEVERDPLDPVDDPRIDQELNFTAEMVDEGIDEGIDFPEGLTEAERIVRSGNAVVTVALRGTVSTDVLAARTAAATTAVLDALAQDVQAGPRLDSDTVRADAVTRLAGRLGERAMDAAGVESIDLAGPDFYRFGVSGQDDGELVYDNRSPDMVVFATDSDLGQQWSGFLQDTAHTGGWADTSVYADLGQAPDNPMHSRVKVQLWTFDRVEDAQHLLTERTAFAADDLDAPMDTVDDPRLTEQAVHQVTPEPMGPADDPDEMVDGLQQVRFVGRAGNAFIGVDVAGTQDLDVLRGLAADQVTEILDAYGLDG